MSRYIDAENLSQAKFPIPASGKHRSYEIGWNDAINAIIENAPSADVQEVKHAKWEYCGDHHVCSECGEFALFDEYTGEEVLSDYCPNCGARMSKERKE